jgi:hypothetical protein
MKTIIQDFKDQNYRILHAVNKASLTPIETYLEKLRSTYLSDATISPKIKKFVKKSYLHSMKLLRRTRKKLK